VAAAADLQGVWRRERGSRAWRCAVVFALHNGVRLQWQPYKFV